MNRSDEPIVTVAFWIALSSLAGLAFLALATCAAVRWYFGGAS